MDVRTGRTRHVGLSAAVVVAALVLLASGLPRLRPDGAQAATATRPPNIVVIVMDTARQDHQSLYGYERDTSPRLRELAESSTVYTNAHSTSCWTAPAHASLFTGLYSAAHGATQEGWHLDDRLTTIAEVMSEHGYQTTAIVENPVLDPSFGYAQGFSRYNMTWSIKTASEERIPALEQFAEATKDAASGKPFFVFVNLIEPHSPYDSSRWFRNTFVSDQTITVESSMTHKYYLGRRKFTAAELRHLNELYDAELLFTDYVVGRMADELKARGLWDETAFIVTSDHGENIGDHGHMGHRFMLYETAVKIPLLIHWPTPLAFASRVSSPVQLTDLFPTMLAIAGIDGSSYHTHGLNLLAPPASGHREVLCEYYYPLQVLESMNQAERKSPLIAPYLRRMRSLMVDGVKLIWGSDGRNELYDLEKDPGETTNLIDSPAYADLSRSMEKRLLDLVATYEKDRLEAAPAPADSELDPATSEALRSLGYIR